MAAYPPSNSPLNHLASLLYPKRRVFISYHHAVDQWFYDEFSRFFHDQCETVFDNSLERQIESDDVRYVRQRIRDEYITGTSCTIVLIGAQTYMRKYVDWEIKATLDKGHGLIGIALPNHQKTVEGKIIVPARFHDNLTSGYAVFEHWNNLTHAKLTELVNLAAKNSLSLADNSRDMKSQNG